MYGDRVFLAAEQSRRGWSTFAGFTVQCGLVGVALLVPLLSPDGLPRVFLANMPVAPGPLPPPPPVPPGVAQRVRQVVAELTAGRIFLPSAIPDRVAVIVDEPNLAAAQECPGCVGVEGGIQNGVPNGVVDSLALAARQAALAPPPPPQAHAEPASKPIPRIVMGGEVQEAKLIQKVIPGYPVLARQVRVQGEVKFSALISREGTVQNLTLLHGHPMLVTAAVEAIRQWRYRPTILNGEPHEVVTTIIVTFKLN